MKQTIVKLLLLLIATSTKVTDKQNLFTVGILIVTILGKCFYQTTDIVDHNLLVIDRHVFGWHSL